MLTLRMILVTLVGLYTSRIVLHILGVEDYGIYGLVGGIITMASFLNVSMASATSRFITFELGRGDQSKLSQIFSNALIIHMIIAAIVLTLGETIGLWYINHGLNIPDDRIYAANWIYQFSIISMIVGFTQVPYAATIIAHERMSVFAYFEIANVSLKLLLVFLLEITPGDKLILYGLLTTIVSIIIAFSYRIYCLYHFRCTRFKWRLWDIKIASPMIRFSGLDLFNSMSFSVKEQGIAIVLNLFFGVIANAGAMIISTINGIIGAFSGTVTQAFRPQIIKQYAAGDIPAMCTLMQRGLIMSCIILGFITIPLIIYLPTLLQLWLNETPPYTIVFGRLALVSSFFSITAVNAVTPIHATGNIRAISLFNGCLFLSTPACGYIAFLFDAPAQTIFIIPAIVGFMITLYAYHRCKLQIPNFEYRKILSVFFKLILILATIGCISYFISKGINAYLNIHDLTNIRVALPAMAITAIFNFVILSGIAFTFIFDQSMKDLITLKIKSIYNYIRQNRP